MPERPHDAFTHLDDEVERLRSLWDALLDATVGAVERHGGATTRVADLGAGTGVATLGLAQRLDTATVFSVESTTSRHDQIRHAAERLGLGDRVRLVQSDLDDPWPAGLDDLDLVWASMSLHHLSNPVRVLRDARAAVRPGGLVAVVELAPSDAGSPAHGHGHGSHRGADWSPLIEQAGWQVLEQQTFAPGTDDAPRVLTLARR